MEVRVELQKTTFRVEAIAIGCSERLAKVSDDAWAKAADGIAETIRDYLYSVRTDDAAVRKDAAAAINRALKRGRVVTDVFLFGFGWSEEGV